MPQALGELLNQYERGRLSRRELLGAIALLSVAAADVTAPPRGAVSAPPRFSRPTSESA